MASSLTIVTEFSFSNNHRTETGKPVSKSILISSNHQILPVCCVLFNIERRDIVRCFSQLCSLFLHDHNYVHTCVIDRIYGKQFSNPLLLRKRRNGVITRTQSYYLPYYDRFVQQNVNFFLTCTVEIGTNCCFIGNIYICIFLKFYKILLKVRRVNNNYNRLLCFRHEKVRQEY